MKYNEKYIKSAAQGGYRMEKINAALDVYSIIICLLMIVYLAHSKSSRRATQYFRAACAFNIVMIFGDLTDWCCNGLAQPWYPAALHIGQFIYYVSIVPLMYAVWKYVSSYISAYAPVPKLYDRIFQVLCAIHLLGCALNPFTGVYYVISEKNIYYRGSLVFVASLVPICAYLMILVLTLLNRKFLAPREITALSSYVWLPALGHMAQNLVRGLGVLNPCITMALLVMFLNIHMEMDLQYERNKRELDQTQITLMLSQIRPHFLYNSLTAIRRLCEVDPKEAKTAINDFSLFLRANMDSISHQLPVPFEQELMHTKSYLNLEQRRFDDDLAVIYEFGTMDFCLPALTLQPIVENAVLHGIRKKDGGGTVRVQTAEQEYYYTVTVTDDGVGFDKAAIANRPNIGLNNVSRRLELLCGGRLEIESTPGHGTKATIFIPREQQNE